jgi:hypothetical protein
MWSRDFERQDDKLIRMTSGVVRNVSLQTSPAGEAIGANR